MELFVLPPSSLTPNDVEWGRPPVFRCCLCQFLNPSHLCKSVLSLKILKLTQRNRLSRYGTGFALPPFPSMRPITKRSLGGHAATAKRDRRLPRQIPLVPIHVDQSDRTLNAKWPIRTNRNLYRRSQRRLYRHNIQYFLGHKTPLIFAHRKTFSDKASIANPRRAGATLHPCNQELGHRSYEKSSSTSSM